MISVDCVKKIFERIDRMGAMVRFLKPSEYSITRPLNDLCFPDEEFSREYYEEGGIQQNRVVVKEVDGKVAAMAHFAPRKAWYRKADGSEYAESVDYIMDVATYPQMRHKGYMDEILRFAMEEMRREGKNWTFLVPVDPEIYLHLGFTHHWKFAKDETDLLYADEGLTECYACVLNPEAGFKQPLRITA